MRDKKTEYTFSFRGKVTVTVTGADTEENYEKAMRKAICKSVLVIDEDNLEYISSKSCTEEE